jgi:hypothetical protein
MGLALEIFGLAAIVSAAVSLFVAWLARRLLPASTQRATLPAALAIGFFAGYLALPRSWAALAPDQAWHWLPYLGFAAAIAGSMPTRAWLRRLGVLCLAVLAGYFLAPDWPVFGLSRPGSVVIAALYFWLIAALLEALPSRLLGPAFVGLLALTATLSAVAIGAEVSLRFAQLGAIAAGGLAACWLGGFLNARPAEPAIRGLIPLFAVLVGGIAFVGCVEPDPPAPGLLVLPFVPLIWSLWLFRRHPLLAEQVRDDA